jgi:RNA polymerase sigma-70 factor (ECF subfamily)
VRPSASEETPREPSDRELVSRLAAGDRDALGPLMERHHGRVYRIAYSYLRNADDALDAVQETFVKAYQNAARWHPEAEVTPWLVRIAVNQSIDQYRRGRRHAREMPLETDGVVMQLPASDVPADRRVHGREIGERISRAVLELPETQRSVFVLRHYEDMSLEEIAQALGIQLGTVKSALHRALFRLRDRLGRTA